jgi:hypothetical protein
VVKGIVHTTMTLDGFRVRPDDKLDWAFKYAPDEMIGEIKILSSSAPNSSQQGEYQACDFASCPNNRRNP